MRVLTGLLATWGIALSALLWSGRLPASWLPKATAAGASQAANEPVDEDCACARASARAPAGPAVNAPAAAAVELSRFTVCPREENPPRLSRLADPAGRTARWALHCGPSVHLIAFDTAAPALSPRRVARLQLPEGPGLLSPLAGSLAGGDIDGDGTPDLALAQRWIDASGAPAAGALYLIPGARGGGLSASRRIADASAAALLVAALDKAPGDDLVVLHAPDPRLAQPTELWWFSGGAAPARRGRRAATADAETVIEVDLDGDGASELAVLSPQRERVELHVPAADSAEPIAHHIPGLREGLAADLDGDGDRDLLLLGERLWARFAGAGEAEQPVVIAEVEPLRQLSLTDVNADGKLDIVGYAHPALVSYEQRARDAFERHELLRVTGDALAIHEAHLAELDGRPGLDLLLLASSDRDDGAVELALASDVGAARALRCPATVTPLPDAPLHQRLSLP